MRVKIKKTVDAKQTNTYGKYTYVVALRCGGLMEDPDFHYKDYQIIRADSEDEARKKYNQLNNCSFYYGYVIKQIK